MTEALASIISQAVDLFLDSIVIIAILGLFSTVILFSAVIAEQEAVGVEMREIAEFNQYDCEHVRNQDIISAIYEYRGEPKINVKIGSTTFVWSTVSAPTKYVTKDIANKIANKIQDETGGARREAAFDATIDKDINGRIDSITFTMCDGSSCVVGGD